MLKFAETFRFFPEFYVVNYFFTNIFRIPNPTTDIAADRLTNWYCGLLAARNFKLKLCVSIRVLGRPRNKQLNQLFLWFFWYLLPSQKYSVEVSKSLSGFCGAQLQNLNSQKCEGILHIINKERLIINVFLLSPISVRKFIR